MKIIIILNLDKLKYWNVRSKQEIKTSLAEAETFIEGNEFCWPRTMLFYTYSLWFLQLPSMIYVSRNKTKILKLSFKVNFIKIFFFM